jgi:hypothetical protein
MEREAPTEWAASDREYASDRGEYASDRGEYASDGEYESEDEQRSRQGEREELLDRLQRMRAALPAFATDAAQARRKAARLRIENEKLIAEVRRLQRRDQMAHR